MFRHDKFMKIIFVRRIKIDVILSFLKHETDLLKSSIPGDIIILFGGGYQYGHMKQQGRAWTDRIQKNRKTAENTGLQP